MIRETSYGQTFGELYRETEDLFNTVDDGCHDFDHTLRVLHNAELLLTHYPAANKEVVRLAALLHDIGRVGESKTAGAPCHAETGAAKAVQMLLSHGYDMPTAVQVGEAVRTHRYRGDVQPETLEGQIIFDADKLDSLGAVGIGRAFLFAGMVGARVHNTAEKQTVFAFNNFNAGKNCDLGIGNNPGGNPDWTFAGNAKKYNSPEIFIVAKIDNMKISDKPVLNPARFLLLGTTDKNAVSYQPGETMTFTLNGEFAGQKPEGLQVAWTRTGDDGKKETGCAPISADNPVVIKTQLDQPGFVYIYATLVDADGKPVTKQRNGSGRIVFEGGAGVQPEKLTSSPEPADFDQFWARQREKLAAVPVKAKMEKVKTTANADIYAVSVDCAGPRPVTGYLTIPVNAAEKSLPVRAMFQGYGTGVQGVPGDGPTDEITFNVNAHGYDLGRDGEYYKEFFENIKSNGQAYAFDPVQNSDPETAYFNGMALRVMRALEFLKTLPQWNGRDLVVTGGSQGGRTGIVAAGLDDRVAAVVSTIPHFGNQPYLDWAAECNRIKSDGMDCTGAPPVPDTPRTRCLAYYDPMNFAPDIQCPILYAAGTVDPISPPYSTYAVYRRTGANREPERNWYNPFSWFRSSPVDKELVWFPGLGHDWSSAFDRRAWRWLDERLQR